MKNMPE